MQMNLSYEQLNNEYSMLMGILGVSISKHLMDEHFTCIWANEYYYKLIHYTKAEYERLFHNHCDEYFRSNPDSWETITEKVRVAVENGDDGYTAFVPMIYPDGASFWLKLQVGFTDEYIDGCKVAYTTMTDVTEMMQERYEKEHIRQTYEQISQEQNMLMSALNVSVSKHLIDEHFTCTWANDFYFDLIGYPRPVYDELFHGNVDAFFSSNPDAWELLTKKVADTMEKGEDVFEIFLPMIYPDGSSYWIKLVSFFTDEYVDGVRTAYTVMTNVTELVQMQKEQKMLMDAMKVSVSRHLVDEHFTVIWANDFYYDLIGYPKAEYERLFHNRCDEYFANNQDGWDLINKKIVNVMEAGGRNYEAFVPMKRPDGSTFWVKLVGFFLDEYQDGRQLAYTTMINVTDLLEVQKERTIAYDNIPGFIAKYRVLPHAFQMVAASERVHVFFDADMERILAHDPLDMLQPDSRRLMEEQLPRMRNGEAFEGVINVKNTSDREWWFKINCTCIDSIADDPVYLAVFIDITDITQLRELKQELEERTRLLNEALETAKRANQAKSDFLSRMSHDIRTPMNAIAGMTEIAGVHLDDRDRVKDCLQKIRLSSRHLLGLINDVLDMSQIENQTFALNLAPISLPGVLRDVILIVLSGIRERDQVFDVRLRHVEHEQIISDALRLRQILLNLLSNAAKFTPVGGRILFEVEELPPGLPDGARLRFTVADNGCGMSREFLEHIFDPFTREQDSRTDKVEGSGLGMAITKKLVDMLDGVITVDSAPGEGATFRVELPVSCVEEAETQSPITDLCALVVDHDPVAGEFIVQTLKALGIAADQACRKDEALKRAVAMHEADQDYRFIILDMDLPEAEALHTAAHIRALLGAAAPALLLAAYDWSGIKAKAVEAGIDGFIEKPVFRSDLRRCLGDFLSGEAVTESGGEVYDFRGKRFLLVEDNELNREIAIEMLAPYGVELETAVHGAEALERFRNSVPGYYDLILMDIQMPVMNGYEAARAIRALPKSDAGTVPILAMTADAFTEDIREAKKAGMNGHMAKPLDFHNLAQEIHQYVNRMSP